jgi:hypothetical protein
MRDERLHASGAMLCDALNVGGRGAGKNTKNEVDIAINGVL